MATMMTFHIPEDPAYLQTVGAITIAHGHLDYVLRMTIKSLTGLSVEEARDATNRQGTWKLRNRVNKLAEKRLGEGDARLKLQALLTRCERATEQRDELIHNLCAKELDGPVILQIKGKEWGPLPSVTELDELFGEIYNLTIEINQAGTTVTN